MERERDKDLPREDDDKDMDKEKDKEKGKEKGKDKDKGGESEEDAFKLRARVIFVLPEGSKLHVDDQLVDSTFGTHTFRTPRLAEGRRYYYDVRVEVERDGKPVSSTRRIVLRAGSVIRADFSDLGTAPRVLTVKGR
jgi:uncharacterized protein (TIGR03000 family)